MCPPILDNVSPLKIFDFAFSMWSAVSRHKGLVYKAEMLFKALGCMLILAFTAAEAV